MGEVSKPYYQTDHKTEAVASIISKEPQVKSFIKMAAKYRRETGHSLDRFCAEYTVDILDDIKWGGDPLKPEIVLEYEMYPDEVRRKLNHEEGKTSDFFRKNPAVVVYYKKRDSVRLENSSNYDWLIHCRTVLADFPERLAKIDAKLKECHKDQLWKTPTWRKTCPTSED